ncbi:MAG: helix-turn-helix domain-containing protein [Hyphomicrobiaceae bacterium]
MSAVSAPTAPATQLMSWSNYAIDQNIDATRTRIIERKENVFTEGDDVTHIYRVEAVHVCIYRMLADGRRQIVGFAFPGDFIGLGAVGHHTTNAEATERTRLQSLPVSDLHRVVRDSPQLGLDLYAALSEELASTRELLISIGQKTAQERVAGFLLLLSKRNVRRGEDPDTIVLPMTRTDIADYLGLTIETVSRTMTKLRMNGLIDIEQCIIVTIQDHEALNDVAEGVSL